MRNKTSKKLSVKAERDVKIVALLIELRKLITMKECSPKSKARQALAPVLNKETVDEILENGFENLGELKNVDGGTWLIMTRIDGLVKNLGFDREKSGIPKERRTGNGV